MKKLEIILNFLASQPSTPEVKDIIRQAKGRIPVHRSLDQLREYALQQKAKAEDNVKYNLSDKALNEYGMWCAILEQFYATGPLFDEELGQQGELF